MEKNEFPYIVNICYIINSKNEVLLQEKARGFGMGKWNGPGGKIKPGENVEGSVIREVMEETNIKVIDPEKMAELEFVFTENSSSNNYCHVFIVRNYSGEPTDMGEGRLRWFPISELPLDKMWDDDKYWLKEVLNGKKLHMRFYFDNNGKVIDYLHLKGNTL